MGSTGSGRFSDYSGSDGGRRKHLFLCYYSLKMGTNRNDI